MDCYLSQIFSAAFTMPITGAQICNGATLNLSQNQALFSLLSNRFGGDGTTNFAIPDLRGRAVIGQSGVAPFIIGSSGGSVQQVLTAANLPAHTHTATVTVSGSPSAFMQASSANGTSPTPGSAAFPAIVTDGSTQFPAYGAYDNKTNIPVQTNAGNVTVAVASAGAGTPVSTLPPYCPLQYYIAMTGYYPSRL